MNKYSISSSLLRLELTEHERRNDEEEIRTFALSLFAIETLFPFVVWFYAKTLRIPPQWGRILEAFCRCRSPESEEGFVV